MRSRSACFFPGQVVHHRRQGYRGVVIDVDPAYEGSSEWYLQVARSRPPKNRPWYHVLVDGTELLTYVAERHLSADQTGDPVEHPNLALFFSDFRDGSYVARRPLN